MMQVFQSTRPSRGATIFKEVKKMFATISIHAPLAGRDLSPSGIPRDSVLFQSTRPSRGATFLLF